MEEIEVTIRVAASGELVRQFRTNDAQFADEQVAMWLARYGEGELTVERSGREDGK